MEREVMANADLAHFAEIGLILFVVAFVLIVIRIAFMNRDHAGRMKEMPLEEGGEDDETSPNPREVPS